MDKTSSLEGNTCQRVFPLFQQYREELISFVNRRLQNKAQSEALVSDVLMKMHRQCEQLDHIRNIRAWLFQVARNTVNDYFREQARISGHVEADQSTLGEWSSEGTEVVASLLPSLMSCLPEKYARPLLMSDLEGIPQKAIAQQLNLSLSGVKSRIQRGRQKLKEVFHECLYLEMDQQGMPVDFTIKPHCIRLNQAENTTATSCIGQSSC